MTLRPGTDTGSLVNHLYSRMTKGQPMPEVGMGCTILAWSDRHAGTIDQVTPTKTGFRIMVRRDTATVVSGSGHDGSAVYNYARNPEGARFWFEFKPGKGWFEVRLNDKTNRWVDSKGYGLRIGSRETYRDPSF